MKVGDLTFVARCCFLAWLMHQSGAWGFNTTGTAPREKNPNTKADYLFSRWPTSCPRCRIFTKPGAVAPPQADISTVVDRIVIPYITRQKNGSEVTSFSTRILHISGLGNDSYVTQLPTSVIGQLKLTYANVFIDSGEKCGGALTQFPRSCIEPEPCLQGGASSGPDVSYVNFVSWDFDSVGTHAHPPRTPLSKVNQLATISARFAGLSLDRCEEFARFFPVYHEDEKTLTLLATSTGAPIFVDGPREDAQRHPKSITQKPHPITNAYKDTKLPRATPGIHLSISSLSQTALEPIVPVDVILPLPSKLHEKASPLAEDYVWKYPAKGSSKGQPTNEGIDELRLVTQQAGKLASKQAPEPSSIHEALSRTQQAEQSVPAQTASPDSVFSLINDQLQKVDETKPAKFNLDARMLLKGNAADVLRDHEKVPVLLALDGSSVPLANPSTPPLNSPDGSSVSLANPSTPPFNSPVYETRIGSSAFEVSHMSKSGLIIDSQTLLSDEVATMQKISISLRSFVSTVAIGSNAITLSSLAVSTPGQQLQTINLPSLPLPTPVQHIKEAIINSLTFLASELPSSAILIGSQTPTPGSSIIVQDEAISLLPENKELLPGHQTVRLQSLTTPQTSLSVGEVVIGSTTFNFPILSTASLTFLISELPSSDVLIGSQTPTPGNRIRFQDEAISLLPENKEVLLGHQTMRLQSLTTPQTSLSVGEVVIGSTTFNFPILSPASIQIDSQILKPGDIVTINGHQVSFLLSSPTSTVERKDFPMPNAADVSIQTIALGKEKLVISHDPSSRVIIGNQNLAPGSAIVYHGKTISLPTSGSVIIVESSTFLLLPVSVSSASKAKESHSFEPGQLSLSGPESQVNDKTISSSTATKSARIPRSTARQENRFMSTFAPATAAEKATETATATGTEGSTKKNGVAVSNRLGSRWRLIPTLFLGGYIAACLL